MPSIDLASICLGDNFGRKSWKRKTIPPPGEILARKCLFTAYFPSRKESKMSENCCYSFLDLFVAAHGRNWTESERESFAGLDQTQRNREVRRLVDLTNGSWACADRHWHDGVTYTAFWRDKTS